MLSFTAVLDRRRHGPRRLGVCMVGYSFFKMLSGLIFGGVAGCWLVEGQTTAPKKS